MADQRNDRLTIDRADAPHIFDPVQRPELFDRVPSRRILAFIIDALILTAIILALGVAVFLLGLITLGLGWSLFAILGPATCILYVAFTVASGQATWGMRAMGLTMRMWYGDRPGFLIGAAHATLFWVSATFLPVINLLPPLFDARKRMFHDMVLGTVIVDAQALANRA